MAIKKLTLTEDHLKLIAGLRLDKFVFGEKYHTSKMDDTIEDLEYCKKRTEETLNEYKENTNISASNLKLAETLEVSVNSALESTINARKEVQKVIDNNSHYAWGLDQWNLWGGGYIFEDISRLIGKNDQVLPGTVNSTTGPRFPDELEEYMLKLYHDIYDNIEDILNLVFQFITQGGLKPGTYKCINYIQVWEKVEEKE